MKTLAKAIAEGHRKARLAGDGADLTWIEEADWHIYTMPKGTLFLAEEVAEWLAEHNITTTEARAMGDVILRARRLGLIEPSGEVARAKTSNGNWKPVWRRTKAK